MSCPRFVQNAWKRDLCSNCFKGKEDHVPVVDNRARYLAKLKELTNTKQPAPQSILKGVRKSTPSVKVHFPAEESQVIGYGGEDFSENEDEEDTPYTEVSEVVEEKSIEGDDDTNIQKLTEFNTEFNKNPANLLMSSVDNSKLTEIGQKASNAVLKLGQIQNSSDGKKQTLLVLVQPFRSSSNTNPLAESRKTHLNNLLHDTTDSIKLPDGPKVKTISTSMTNSEKSKKDNSDLDSIKENKHKFNKTVSSADNLLINNITIESEPKIKSTDLTTEYEKQENETKDNNGNIGKVNENKLPSVTEERRGQITRGTILTKSHEQMKAKRFVQLCAINTDSEFASENLSKNLESNDLKSPFIPFAKAKDTILLKSSSNHKPIDPTELFSPQLKKDLTNDKTNNSKLNKSEEVLKAVKECPFVNIQKASKDIGESLDKDGIFIIDGVLTETREMAGEPDGKADSDDLDEPPPDLPKTTPPNIINNVAKPSFLHNHYRNKPTLPVKAKVVETNSPEDLVLDQDQLKLITSDPSLSPNSRDSLITKRRAPMPPPTQAGENPIQIVEGGSPEHRERASSYSPLPYGSSPTQELFTRRSLSLSHEVLMPSSSPLVSDKKKNNKMSSTLRRFLRLSSREELKGTNLEAPPTVPRPRPEIIHPLDLNKSAVQVLSSDGSLITTKPRYKTPRAQTSTGLVPSGFYGRPNKPPPPPRSQSLDSSLGTDSRPSRPPPPKKNVPSSQSACQSMENGDAVYVNLGEVSTANSSIKPQQITSPPGIDGSDTRLTSQAYESIYESLAPECDFSTERSSLTYYGSETESDIYCPYTYANYQQRVSGTEGSCKGRSIIHKTLEDNYRAITHSNHEALTNLMEQVHDGPMAPTALRSLKRCLNLKMTDFTIEGDGDLVGEHVFQPAVWKQTPVTLCLSASPTRIPHSFMPIAQFFDEISGDILHKKQTELVQVSVAVLVRQKFFNFRDFVAQFSPSGDVREVALLLIQLSNNLNSLQSEGRDEANLSQLVLSREDPKSNLRVYLLPDTRVDSKSTSLCKFAVNIVELLSIPQPLRSALCSVLVKEQITSLAQMKSILELWLWGPSHAPITNDVQGCLQRWLDLERATVLQSMVVCRRSLLNSADYCRLSFLIKTNAKIMADTFSLLDPSIQNVTPRKVP